jgi:pimeloyl-ACP methyl ester carboxylesterase
MKEFVIEQNGRAIGASVYGALGGAKEVTLFLHGFKGYKDWGQFPLLCQEIASRSEMPVIAINFTHNGTSLENPREFVDLEKFGRNTFSEELEDVYAVMVYLQKIVDPGVQINIIGHSRGGSTAILAASQLGPVKKVIGWAPVIDVFSRYAFADLEEWQKEGVKYVRNGRTGQDMPLYVGLAHDLLGQQMRYDVTKVLNRAHKDYVLILGDADEVVLPTELAYITNPKVRQVMLAGAGHTFGGSEPWVGLELPSESKALLDETIIALRA